MDLLDKIDIPFGRGSGDGVGLFEGQRKQYLST